jgi:hypothetical protein
MERSGFELPAQLLFECGQGWVFSCRRKPSPGLRVGGILGILVERVAGEVRELGAGGFFGTFLGFGKTWLLCVRPELRTAALIDRILELSEATLAEMAGACVVMPAEWEAVLLDTPDKIDALMRALASEGFEVACKDFSKAKPS